MSKIKFGIGALEAARDNYKILFDRLVRGYKSVVGKDPEGLDLLKIKQEAKQRADESAKVVDMKNRTLDPSKPIMGGSQDFITRQKPKTKKGELFNISGQKGKFLTEDEFARELESDTANFIQNSPGFNLQLIPELKKPGAKAYNPFPDKQGDRFLTDDQRQRVLSRLERIMKNEEYQMRFADNFADLMKEGDDVIEFAPDLFKIDPPKKADGGLAGFAGDQRFGFKKGGMSRRDFMKIIGGLAALPVVGKFFKAAEPVAKVATKATEGVKIGLDKFMMLVDKIKRSGRPAPGRRTQDLQEVTLYRGKDGSEYELTEDLATGDLTVTKDRPGGAYYGDNAFETIDDRTIMEYKKGQPDVDPDSRTAFTTADEYEEGRAIANRDGEFDDIDEVDDRVVEEILEEIKPSKIKRAGGGLAYMLGE